MEEVRPDVFFRYPGIGFYIPCCKKITSGKCMYSLKQFRYNGAETFFIYFELRLSGAFSIVYI